MIVNTICTITYTTVDDASAWYSVPFTYTTVLNVPQITVMLDGTELSYGSDYVIGVSGVQLTVNPGAGKTLVVDRSTPLTQDYDFQTGLVDPDSIENALDLAAMRDQELARDISEFRAGSPVVVTLAAEDWDEGSQTVTVQGVTASNIILVASSPASTEIYTDAGIICTTQAENALTFECDQTPDVDLTVNIVILR